VTVDDRFDLARYADDFEGFAELLDIVPSKGARERLRLWPLQRKFCRARTGRDIVCKPRRLGFTTLELARDVWTLLFQPGAQVVVVCQSATGDGPTKLLSAALTVMFDSLAALGVRLPFGREATSEWTLPDRDASLRIVTAGASAAAAQKKGRAGGITRLHVTELAFWEYPEETMLALLPCVPSVERGTEIVLETTPNGAAGYYYEAFMAAREQRSDFTAHFFAWFEQPEYFLSLAPGEVIAPANDRERELVTKYRVSAEQLKWYRAKLAEPGATKEKVDQEYPTNPETAFRLFGKAYFDEEATSALAGETRDPIATELSGALRIWEYPRPGTAYVAIVDPSEGTGGDPGAITVWERATGAHVATLHGQFATWALAGQAAVLARRYNDALLVVERNNHGHAVIQALRLGIPANPEQGILEVKPYAPLFHGRDDKPGWVSTEVSRATAIENLENAVRTREFRTPDARLVGEIRTIVRHPRTGKVEAAAGAHDDLFITAAIARDVLVRPVAREASRPRPFTSLRMGGGRGF
jgi:hypothetical protein